MKLIIDIPEDDYNNIEPFLNGETIKGGFNLFKVLEMIKNGIPLDDLRTEIEENINYNKKMNYQGIVAGLLLTLDIIDKYKGEQE